MTMSQAPDQPETTDAAHLMMRRVLHQLDVVRAAAARDTDDVRQMRGQVRSKLQHTEREARADVLEFAPDDIGAELRDHVRRAFPTPPPPRRPPMPPPATLTEAEVEWSALAEPTRKRANAAVTDYWNWKLRTFKRRKNMPEAPSDLWGQFDRLSEIYAALPELRERAVAQRLDAVAYLNEDLEAEIALRQNRLRQGYADLQESIAELEAAVGVAGGSWAHPGWEAALPSTTMESSIRIGQFEPQLPSNSGVRPVPALLDYPFVSGIAISAGVDQRAAAIDLARTIVLRVLAATPAGNVRFIFFDPVSLGQAIADFRHLAEFDPRLVDTKTWTSERDIEARLEGLADHLELVISTYLRGQFDSIDDYNEQAGEVAEPYRVLVVLDYPSGFTSRSARQLLSLIENGTRCGVHTILVHDPSSGSPEDVPLDRLTHSMQRIDLRTRNGVTLAAPIGHVDLGFLPDASPLLSFDPDGRALSPFSRLLLNVGTAARTTESGPVTLDRVVSIVNRQIAAGREPTAPDTLPGARDLVLGDPSTWWNATTANGAHAPIGRAGAQDVAAMYFSSTEIAGGAIMVGLPRSGKSTALHAAIMSMATRYGPDELELYLVDSKHGVEFKVYERLPHARLVSIHSEREFSVSVLESLNGEIRRRAELMKRHTAGRANLTEYRAATGESLPRIVLLMDEFHELFEEDDAFGRRAFQAFSDIVRLGPFAGIHIVVSSQTLSSIPAMDRSTLTLLPMRVAFMCNELDADIVMGDLNREVKALNQRGEGILNPLRGDVSHNKPFRGLYIAPDEREALLTALEAKAVAVGMARRPRVFDGDRLAERPVDLTPSPATRPAFPLGEPFDLEPSAGLALRRGRGGNVLVLGALEHEDQHDSAVLGAIHSLVTGAATASMTAHVVDFVGDGDGGDTLDLLSLCARTGASYRRASALADLLASIEADLADRLDRAEYTRGGVLVVLHGLQRALDLAPQDPFADPQDAGQDCARALARILRDGPEVGCHVVVAIDQLAQFDRRLGRDLLTELDWRVAGSDATNADINAITDSFTEQIVPRSQLLVVDHARGRSRRVRAYPPYTVDFAPRPTGTPNEQ
jgi:hypothetical protein